MSSAQNSPFSLTLGGTVAAFCLVKLSSGEGVANTATATDEPVGIAQEAGVDGDVISVKDIKDGGIQKVKAAGAITKGVDVYAAADGEVQALPAASGTYLKVGKALKAAAADGDIIEVWMDPTRESAGVTATTT